MKQKQLTLLLIGLISLVIFASMIALVFYIKQQQLQETIEPEKSVFVARIPIHKGEKITANNIVLRSLPVSYTGPNPLGMGQIIGNYAAVEIMGSDLITLQKLSAKPLDENGTETGDTVTPLSVQTVPGDADRFSIPLNLFKNPDMSLRSGDMIDIIGIGIDPGEQKHFQPRYLALGVKIGGFLKNGKPVESIVSISEDPKTHEAIPSAADSIVLGLNPSQINRMLSLYYSAQEINNNRAYNPNNLYQGHIWMVRCGTDPEADRAKYEGMNSPELSSPLPRTQIRTGNSKPVQKPKSPSEPRHAIVTYEQ